MDVVYLITSADHRAADPATLAVWVQDHWGIENRLHWVRDVTFDEDRSQIRTRTAPQPWPPCATPPSACYAWLAPPTSPPYCDITLETPNKSSTYC